MVEPEEVRSELRNILAAEAFRRSEHSRRLLQILVEYALAGRSDELKEYSLAVEAFGRKPSFDPRLDPIVRVEAGRLRRKLNEYYETAGRESAIRILIPLRRYTAEFRRTAAPPATPAPIASAPPLRRTRILRRWRWMLALVSVLLVVCMAVVWEKRPAAAARAPLAHTPSIAVIPFADLSRASTQELLADTLTEEVIEALSHIEGLHVVSRLGSFNMKGKSEDVMEMGRRLGVSYLLEGSVNCAGGRVRVITRLIDAANGYRVWSKRFVRELPEMAPVEEQLADTIVDEVRQQLGLLFHRPFIERDPPRPEADERSLKGGGFSGRWRSTADLHKSPGFIDRADGAASGYTAARVARVEFVRLAKLDGAALPTPVVHGFEERTAKRAPDRAGPGQPCIPEGVGLYVSGTTG